MESLANHKKYKPLQNVLSSATTCSLDSKYRKRNKLKGLHCNASAVANNNRQFTKTHYEKIPSVTYSLPLWSTPTPTPAPSSSASPSLASLAPLTPPSPQSSSVTSKASRCSTSPVSKVSHLGANKCKSSIFLRKNCSAMNDPLLVDTNPAATKVLAKKSLARDVKATSRRTRRFTLLPSLGTTSFFTVLTLLCLETVLLSTVSNCAKTFYMHWNTTNSIFRIDNTDHIIDVNKGNLAFEFDQVHIICPVYEPGTFENETEKYIIYNVSKVEYETCRITNADPRVIAICDKPQKLMFFTITFRPFTPQPGGLEFLPGNDYYFISTSSKDDLYRRIGGRCSTNNMKVVFKVCCAPEEKNKTLTIPFSGNSAQNNNNDNTNSINENNNVDIKSRNNNNNNQQINTIHPIGGGVVGTSLVPSSGININSGGSSSNGVLKPINGPTSINTNIDQFNRIPIQGGGINIIGNNNIDGGNVGLGSHGNNGILHSGINMIPTNGMIYPGQTGLRINNVPNGNVNHPSHKSGNNNNNHNDNDHRYDKHPNEVVKNEELTYTSAAGASLKVFGGRRRTPLPSKLDTFILDLIQVNTFTSTNIFLSSILEIVNRIYIYFTEILQILNLSHIIYIDSPLIVVSLFIVLCITRCMYNSSSSSLLSFSLPFVLPVRAATTTAGSASANVGGANTSDRLVLHSRR